MAVDRTQFKRSFSIKLYIFRVTVILLPLHRKHLTLCATNDLMPQLDFYQFLRSGQMEGLTIGSKETDVINLLGQPTEIEDYGRKGRFLHYDYLRFGINDGYLSDVTYFFYNTEACFSIQLEEETYQIKDATPLTTVLSLLNECKVSWEIPFQESNLDYALVKLKNGIKIYYQLYTNKLDASQGI